MSLQEEYYIAFFAYSSVYLNFVFKLFQAG
jgi:hypothetical protein